MNARAAAAGCALVSGTLAFGCSDSPGDIRTSGAVPPAITSVGPTPGPGADDVGYPNPFAGDRGAAGAGRRLFTQFNCAGCHGEHGGGGMGPSLRDRDWIFGENDAQIFSSISEGRGHGMPAWHSRLDGDQVWRLVAYITSLRTRNEPEPPVE
jgi:cytochrome c oxidase cbb3-type subunit III